MLSVCSIFLALYYRFMFGSDLLVFSFVLFMNLDIKKKSFMRLNLVQLFKLVLH